MESVVAPVRMIDRHHKCRRIVEYLKISTVYEKTCGTYMICMKIKQNSVLDKLTGKKIKYGKDRYKTQIKFNEKNLNDAALIWNW